MSLKKLFLPVIFAVAAFSFASCDLFNIDKPEELTITPFATITPDTLNFTIEGGSQEVVVVSNVDLVTSRTIIDALPEEKSDWLSESAPVELDDSTSKYTFTVAPNPAPGKSRSVKVTFAKDSTTVSVVIKQDGLSRDLVDKSISEIKALLTDPSAEYNIENDYIIRGTVVSDLSEQGGNINNKSLLVQDGNTANCGICIRFNEADKANKFLLGDRVMIVIKNSKLSFYNGTLQLTLPQDDLIYKDESSEITNQPLEAKVITVEQLLSGEYQSMYVQIDSCQVKEAKLNSPMSGNIPIEVKNVEDGFTMYTASGASFAQEIVPDKNGSLKGIAGVYNTTFQIQPVLFSDLSGMTEERFVKEKTTTSLRDDFASVAASNTYSARETTEGWIGSNCAVFVGSDDPAANSNPTFGFIGGPSVTAFTINGKTTAVGEIISPIILNGCGNLNLKYGYAFTENNGISFKIEILQNKAVVNTFTVTKTKEEVEKFGVYTFSTPVNVTGKFQIKITNLSPTNSTSNKDRYSIWDITWTNKAS